MGDSIFGLNFLQETSGASAVLGEFNSKLTVANDKLTTLKGVQNNAIMNQDKVNQLVIDENARLLSKKQHIDEAVENQKRIVYFNENNQKKTMVYIKILVTVVIGLFIILAIYIYAGIFIPLYIVYILIIATGVISGIISINLYFTIISRDNYNFDELKYDTLPIPGTVSEEDKSKNGAFNFNQMCIGEQCCNPPTSTESGTVWDGTLGQCLFAPPTAPNPAPTASSATSAAPARSG